MVYSRFVKKIDNLNILNIFFFIIHLIIIRKIPNIVRKFAMIIKINNINHSPNIILLIKKENEIS